MGWIRTIDGIYLNVDQIAYILDEPMDDAGVADIVAYMSNGAEFDLTSKCNMMEFIGEDGEEETRFLTKVHIDIFVESLIFVISELELNSPVDMDYIMGLATGICCKKILEEYKWGEGDWEKRIKN